MDSFEFHREPSQDATETSNKSKIHDDCAFQIVLNIFLI